jgi:energy-coupling factor transport system ATP-binding protein
LQRARRDLDFVAWLEQLCEWFELSPLLERSPFTLSEGEKKRVALVATLAARPTILALDEPTTGQDAVFRANLVRVLRELPTRGMTILIATHDVEFADQVASRWLVLGEGTLLADASPDQVMRDAALLTRAALQPTAQWQFQHAWQQVGATVVARSVHV